MRFIYDADRALYDCIRILFDTGEDMFPEKVRSEIDIVFQKLDLVGIVELSPETRQLFGRALVEALGLPTGETVSIPGN